MEMKHIDLCSGIGGFALAARWMNWATIQFCEIDSFCQKVLVKNFPGTPIHDNLKTFDATKFLGFNGILTAGYPCFTAGTMILSRSGYKPIEEIRIGDEVLTHQARWQKVTSVMQKDNASIREIRAQGCAPIFTTDEHPFYIRKRTQKYNSRYFAEPEWVNASELDTHHFTGQCLPPEIDDNYTIEYWWLVGRYLADGWRQKRRKTGAGNAAKNSGKVTICCNKKEADLLQERIINAGFHSTRNNDRTTTRFQISNQEFYRWLEPFGSLAHGKKLPDFALALPRNKAKALLDGYVSGDGYRFEGNGTSGSRVTTVSKALALSVALLAQKAYSVIASVRQYKGKSTKEIEGRLVNQNPQWFVTVPVRNRSGFIEGEYGWKKIRSNTTTGTTGTVYNIAVNGDESYIADGAIVHNCQPFSQAGKRQGENDDRHLWPEVFRIVKECKPRWCCFENVAGHISMGLDAVLSDLESEGYACQAVVIPACATGAPHRRDRVWIIAFADATSTEQQRDSTGILPSDAGRQSDRQSHGEASTDELRSALEGGIIADTINPRLQGSEQRRAPSESEGTSRSIAEFYQDAGDANGQRQLQPKGTLGEIGRRTSDAGETFTDTESAISRSTGDSRTGRAGFTGSNISDWAGGEFRQPSPLTEFERSDGEILARRIARKLAQRGAKHSGDVATRKAYRKTLLQIRSLDDGLPGNLARRPGNGTEIEVGGDREYSIVRERVSKLRALGNAICPPVVLEIFKAIEEAQASDGRK